MSSLVRTIMSWLRACRSSLRSGKPFRIAFVLSNQAVSGKKKESQYFLAVFIEANEFGANAFIANVINGSST